MDEAGIKLLKEVQYALNEILNTHFTDRKGNDTSTYELASKVDKYLWKK